jgi:hypothetical protein
MASMLLVDGPASGTVVSGTGVHRVPFRWRDHMALYPDPADDLFYMPKPIQLLGHVIWVGLSGDQLPPFEELFDLLVSVTVKQCEDG